MLLRFRIFLLLLLPLAPAAGAQSARNVKLLCNWNDTTNAPVNGGGQHYNDVWGFTHRGKEYAVIGSTNGAHIIDVDHCKEVVFAPGRSQLVVHRDYKTYQHYLYAVADEGITSTLQVFDFSYLPDSLHLVYESTPADFNRCHNIFIDTANAKLYCASFSNTASGHDHMRIYSLQQPDAPVLIDRYNEVDNVHDVFVRNDTAYCSSSFTGYVVLDCTHPPAHPIIGGLVHYPYQGYNHSSWLNEDKIGVMADETHSLPLKVIDARTLPNVKVLSTFSPRPGDSTCIPHNPFVIGHFAFISYYFDGLQIWDLSDPYAPRQAGFYDTYPGPSVIGFAGAWGCYPFLPSGRVLVSDMQTGLYVLNADDALGIKKDTARLRIYPNPVTAGTIYMQLPAGASGNVSYVIHDIVGRLIQGGAVYNPGSLPIALPLPIACPAGLYVLQAQIDGQMHTVKFLKL